MPVGAKEALTLQFSGFPRMNLSEKPILGHFNFCPSCGTAAKPHLEKSIFFCGDCDLEMHFSPVSSAAALIQDRDGNLLFTKRRKEPHKGKLGIPGGFVNPGEQLETAMLREVKEEVGIQLDSWKYLGGWPNEYSYKSVVYSVNDVYFVAKVENFKNIQICPDEIDGIHIENPNTINFEDFSFPSLKAAVLMYLNNYHKE